MKMYVHEIDLGLHKIKGSGAMESWMNLTTDLSSVKLEKKVSTAQTDVK
jgi:hypothetical protein